MHRLWILFEDSNTEGVISGTNQRYLVLQSPLKTWSRHTIDLRQLYSRFGWALPVFSERIEQPVRFSARQGWLSLIAGTTTDAQSKWVFGPIEHIGEPKPVKDVLDNPDAYYVRIGNAYQAQRNYDLAERSYLRALTFNPQNADAYFGLGTVRLTAEKFKGAQDAFLNAIRLGYFNPAQAYKGLGWAAYGQHNDLAALQHFEEALRLFGQQSNRTNASAADAYLGASQAALRQELCDSASVYFQRAKAIVPTLEQNAAQWKVCDEIF